VRRIPGGIVTGSQFCHDAFGLFGGKLVGGEGNRLSKL
jgi:hypothetical protein